MEQNLLIADGSVSGNSSRGTWSLWRMLLGQALACWALALSPAVGVWTPNALSGQVPPNEAWRTLQTDHFRVTYPSGLLDLARKAGERAETAYEALVRDFVDPPSGSIDLLITDHADISNGFAQVFPSNRIVVFAPPPVDGFGLAHMDEWMELVITHELVHIFHEDLTGTVGSLFRGVFGRYPAEWPFFPGAATPGWTVEGLATFFESSLTKAGRVRGSFHEMVVRTAILEDRFESIDQASGNSPVWPGGQRDYIYGSLFFQHLVERYGQEALTRFAEEVAGQWIPYRMNSAATKAFERSFSEEWAEWEEELRAEYGALKESLEAWGPLTEGEALTHGGYYALYPAVSPGGGVLAFARQDGLSDTQIRVRDLADGRERKLSRTNRLSNFSWTPDGSIVFSQVEYEDSYRIRGDLFLLDPDDTVQRITDGGRLDHPDVHPEGGRLIAVQEEGGLNRLVSVDLRSGTVTALSDFESGDLWAYPRWSPDGQWIAVSRWRVGAYYDLILLDAQGRVRHQITRDRAIDNAPAWSPDGRWLVWASDQSGLANLYGVEIDPEDGTPGPRLQITNVVGGAAYPTVGPRGEDLYFSSYHADGWKIERIPFEPASWKAPQPLASRFVETVDPDRFERRVQAPEEAYRAVRTLLPTYWSPTFREGDDAGGVRVLEPGFGLSTSGEDLVGRHSYTLRATLAGGFGRFAGGAGYTFAGLGNPLIGISLGQSYDAAPHPLLAPDESGDLLYLIERERSLSGGLTFLRRRARSFLALSLTGSHVWEDLSLLEEDLTETNRFRLSRPNARLGEGRVSLSGSTARSFPFSVSPEDGVSFFLGGRIRNHLGLADSLTGAEGFDRSFREGRGRVSLYKGIPGPGFGNHVLAVRLSGGMAAGPGADQGHFEVGGASGGGLPVDVGVLEGQGLFFPVRGYDTAARFGRYAWTATAEYRFPIKLVNRGPGLFPLHMDWISGTLFLDAGNAWGPELEISGFQNPRRESLVSVGGEITFRVLPLWFVPLDLRFGLAARMVEEIEGSGTGVRGYLRVGSAF